MARLKQIGIDIEVNGAIENARRSFSESENDILRRLLVEQRVIQAQSDKIIKTSEKSEETTRRTGSWTVELLGDRLPAVNLKDAYRQMLLLLSGFDHTFLERFGQESSRSRRYVARSPEALYETATHLAPKHAKLLKDGWFYDTNLSTEQVAKRLRVAARLSHIPYGPKLRILEGLREI